MAGNNGACCGPPAGGPATSVATAAEAGAEAGAAGSAAAVAAPAAGVAPAQVMADVKEYYGEVLKTSKDLKTSACTAGGRPHPAILAVLKKIPAPVTEKFYG
jgi:arsenite methyltransferase